MNPLRSARVMLLAFVVLLAAPGWATTAVIAAAAVALTLRAAGGGVRGWRARRAVAPGRTVLGAGPNHRPVVLSDRELSAHGLILGASGSGKTTALITILAQAIGRGTPVIAIDMKGSPTFAAQLAEAPALAARFGSGRLTGLAPGTRSSTATRPKARTN